jgi:hypothetical protein
MEALRDRGSPGLALAGGVVGLLPILTRTTRMVQQSILVAEIKVPTMQTNDVTFEYHEQP